jgi:hypothetical protein
VVWILLSQMACLCEKSNEVPDFIKCGEFVDKMNDNQLLSKDVLQKIIHKNVYHHNFPRIKQ